MIDIVTMPTELVEALGVMVISWDSEVLKVTKSLPSMKVYKVLASVVTTLSWPAG